MEDVGIIQKLTSKITPEAPASFHESVFNLEIGFINGLKVIIGCTRSNDKAETTHVWVMLNKKTVVPSGPMSSDSLLST